MYIPHVITRSGDSTMRATICKWGNSLGLRIPRGLAEDAGLTEGSVVELRLEDGRLVAEPVGVEKLDALLARVTSKNRHAELLVDSPRGRETW
jgi:antitoxin MazE